MKKILLICLAAMLVLAFTLPAAAKTTLTASGSFVNTGFYLSNAMAAQTGGAAESQAFQEMRANVFFKLQTAPNLWFTFGLNLMDRNWGYRDNTGYNRYWDDSRDQNDITAPQLVVGDDNTMGWNDYANLVEVTHANLTYLVYKGYVYWGRGQSGKGARGAMQTSKVGASRDWKASDSYYDTISVNQTFGAWNLSASTAKIAEGDGPVAMSTDMDYDSHSLGVKYSQKWGYVSGSFNYTRDHHNWTTPYWHPNNDIYNFDGVVYFKMGKAIHLSVEGSYKYGKLTDSGFALDMDVRGWDFMAQGEYIQGPYKFGVMFAITNGQDPTTQAGTAAPKKTVGSDPGDEFKPLYAAFGQYDGLLYTAGNTMNTSQWQATKENSLHAGLQFFYGFADYKMMDKLWLHAALGFMRFDEIPTIAGVSIGNADKNFGTEFDLGANYTIQKGLDLGVHFGYFIPGTWFPAPKGNHMHLDAEITMKF